MPRRLRCGVNVQLFSFFNLGARCGWVVNATPQTLSTLGKDPVPVVQEAGWPEPVWWGAGNLAPTGIRSPDCSAHIQSLYRLHYPALNLCIVLHKSKMGFLKLQLYEQNINYSFSFPFYFTFKSQFLQYFKCMYVYFTTQSFAFL